MSVGISLTRPPPFRILPGALPLAPLLTLRFASPAQNKTRQISATTTQKYPPLLESEDSGGVRLVCRRCSRRSTHLGHLGLAEITRRIRRGLSPAVYPKYGRMANVTRRGWGVGGGGALAYRATSCTVLQLRRAWLRCVGCPAMHIYTKATRSIRVRMCVGFTGDQGTQSRV